MGVLQPVTVFSSSNCDGLQHRTRETVHSDVATSSKLVGMPPLFELMAMHDNMEGTEAAGALASLFYTADSTAAHERDETRMQGFGCGALGNLSSGDAWQAVVNGGGEAAVGAAMRLHTAGADLHGPGPLRRARGAFTPIRKMAAAPYGHQVNRVPCWPNSLSTRL